MACSDQKVESNLSSIISTMAIENVTLDEEQIARCRSILSGETDADEVVAELFEKYKRAPK